MDEFLGIGSGPDSSDYTTEELDECLRDLPIGFETGQFCLHQRWTESRYCSAVIYPESWKITCWNGQVKVARRFLKVEVVESKGLLLTRHDKAIMKKMVEMLELFEEATNIVQLSFY